MAKICLCCGNKNNPFTGDPLYLDNEKILCCNCAKPISDKLNNLYYTKSQDEFENMAIEILSISKTNYKDYIVKYIFDIITNRADKLGFTVEQNLIDKITVSYTNHNINTSATLNQKSTGMFGNIGSKIKGLARFITWIGIISSIISGFAMSLSDDDVLFVIGFIVMIVGSLFSWISSFVLYGFGQLVENSDKIVQLSKK